VIQHEVEDEQDTAWGESPAGTVTEVQVRPKLVVIATAPLLLPSLSGPTAMQSDVVQQETPVTWKADGQFGPWLNRQLAV
jgi:hypothetical protein